MRIFRISSEKYSHGFSASGIANRWNIDGEFVIYAASSRSLSSLEMVVHRSAIRPKSQYIMMIIEVPDSPEFCEFLAPSQLPGDWRKISGYAASQRLGSEWYRSKRSLVLGVPSAVIPQEHNFILNTKHEDFEESVVLIEREAYFWDERLLFS